MDKDISERQKIEKDYHNKKTVSGQTRVFQYSRTLSSWNRFYNLIGDVKDLKVLDFGCGNGWYSRQLAKKGAHVTGIDISEELIKKAFVDSKGLKCSGSVNFAVMPGEDLTFAPQSFDMVVGSAILHHTDLPAAIQNIEKVLKPQGRAIFIEPMNENIFLKIWRKLTPWRRSPVEKALTYADLCFIKNEFPDVSMIFFRLFATFSSGLLLFFPSNTIVSDLDEILDRIDKKVLKRFSKLGKYCAVVVIEMRKTGD